MFAKNRKMFAKIAACMRFRLQKWNFGVILVSPSTPNCDKSEDL